MTEAVSPARAVALGVRFALELAMLAAFAFWGAHVEGGWRAWLLAIAAPLMVALIWGRWLAPKSPRRLADPVMLVVELALFGLAALALVFAGQPRWAAIFGIVALADSLAVRWFVR